MATTTTNYGLTKPAGTDKYDINVQNDNMDTIDAQMKINAIAASTAQSAANVAKTTADEGVANAATAQTTANNASTLASTAKSVADNAKTAADAAQSTADSANVAAANASGTVNQESNTSMSWLPILMKNKATEDETAGVKYSTSLKFNHGLGELMAPSMSADKMKVNDTDDPSYDSAYVRNIIMSSSDPTTNDGNDGDLFFKYE